MRFYKRIASQLDEAIISDYDGVYFFKNKQKHNSKNAAIFYSLLNEAYLYGKKYGYIASSLNYNSIKSALSNRSRVFTKQSWRRFVKMQTFL